MRARRYRYKGPHYHGAVPVPPALILLLAQGEPLAVEERALPPLPEEFTAANPRVIVAPGGARTAWVLRYEDGREALWGPGLGADGAGPGAPHAAIAGPVFSEDGAHAAWAWADPDGRDGRRWEVWLDGKKLQQWEWVGSLSFSPKGEFAYAAGEDLRARDVFGPAGDYYVVRGRKKSAKYSSPPAGGLLWSPDGKRLAFVASKPNGWTVVNEGKEEGPFTWVQGACWGEDGKTLAWTAMDEEGATTIQFGKKIFGADREAVGAPAIGGGALAYLYASKGKRGLVFREEVVPGLYDDLGTPAVSPDGTRVAVAAGTKLGRSESGWVFVDPTAMDDVSPKPEPAPAAGGGEQPGEGALGFLGGALGGGEEKKEAKSSGPSCLLVVDGRPLEGEWERVARPFFSADSARVAALVRDAEGWRMLLDGRVTPAYDQILAPRFAADGALDFGARRGTTPFWVRVPPR